MTTLEKHIAEARALLRPSPVRPHHVPRWLATRLRSLRGRYCDRQRGYSASAVLCEVVTATGGGWLDHWGSTTTGDRPCFVSEPYRFTAQDAASLDQIAESTGLRWYLSANSWWYPGSTIRVVIFVPEDGNS